MKEHKAGLPLVDQSVSLSTATVHTLISSIYAFANDTMTPRKAKMLELALGIAVSELTAVILPRGMTMGEPLRVQDNSRKPIFACAFDSEDWRRDKPTVAHEVLQAVRGVLPTMALPPHYNPICADRDHYFSELLERLNLSGFDTFDDRKGFAIYAPRGVTPTLLLASSFNRKAVMHGPRP